MLQKVNATVVSVVCGILFLLIVYLWFESREDDGEGNKVFSPQKLGLALKNMFGLCLPDTILLYFARICICCGYVGNSCMEHIHAEEEIRETKRMARLAATLSRKVESSKKKKKKSKRKEESDFEALPDEDDIEIGGDDSDDHHLEAHIIPRQITARGQHDDEDDPSPKLRTRNISKKDASMERPREKYKVQTDYVQSASQWNFEDSTTPGEKVDDNRLSLSQHSDSSASSGSSLFNNTLVPKHVIEAHIAVEDQLLAHQTKASSYY
mmetsp:Transcript_19934/g.28651  ORF Transcript_19934/g.28651 Transcript_19934/m.28651 type:complete len:267 (-) Transcript_19934:59-859(-)